MRFFIALEIPEENKAQLELVQQRIKEIIPSAKLTDNSKLHLTIAFIGDQSDALKDQLVQAMAKASQDIQPFLVSPAFIDGFPHLHTARILWIGVNGELDELYKLRHHIKDQLVNLGLPVDERRYIPHIAIAKLTDFQLTPEQEKKIEQLMSEEFEPIRVLEVKLFESIPNHGFHSHNTLAQIRLS